MERKKDKKQARPVTDVREENAQVHPVNPFEQKEKNREEKKAGRAAADLEQQRKEGLTERD